MSSNNASPENEIKEVVWALKRNNQDGSPLLSSILLAARWISPSIHPYANLTSVFFTGLGQHTEDEDEDPPQSSEIDIAEELKVYNAIIKLHPSLEAVTLACADHPRALQNLVHMLETQSQSTRNSDVSQINTAICEYIKWDCNRIEYNREDCPLPVPKTSRGWSHALFASLLYPMATHDHLSCHPEELLQIWEDANNGEIEISESEWPAYLYPSSTSPDVEDDRKGLF